MRWAPLLWIPFVLTAVMAESGVDPTFLRRFVPDLHEAASDITAPGCRYKPIFGAGDKETRIVKGVARFAEITIDPGAACKVARHPREEQIVVILEGSGLLRYGDEEHTVAKEDFMYLPPGLAHGLSNPGSRPLRFVLTGFKIPESTPLRDPGGLQKANIAEVKKQVVGNHPPSTLYQLLMGNFESRRDRIAAGHVLTSLFIMEISPGGTNHPHHHPREEEIYLLLEGEGDMVAGGGVDGIEGRHPARPGDAYFFRLNCTVGFYSSSAPGSGKARILAIRSLYPF